MENASEICGDHFLAEKDF